MKIHSNLTISNKTKELLSPTCDILSISCYPNNLVLILAISTIDKKTCPISADHNELPSAINCNWLRSDKYAEYN